MTTELSAGIDLAGYFDRIGYAGPAQAAVETLHALVAAHNQSIPFENLDPLMGTPVADLGPTALTDKLVHRRRGGYCYEHNGLMGYVLAQLGFGVDTLAGRVVWMNPDDALPAQTHQVLSVTVPGQDGRYLVDVGFGGQTLTSPIRLQAGGSSAPATSRIGCVNTARVTCWRHRSAATGSRSTCSAPGHSHGSTSKSEAGMCQRIRSRSSSSASPQRWSPTTRGGICAAAIWRSTAAVRPSGFVSTPPHRFSTR